MSKQENCNIGFIESCDVPSVYSNKQSYYEVLCYINYKLNELIDVYNSLEIDYKSYVDSQLDSVREYADENDEKHSTADRAYTDLKTNNALDNAKKYTDELFTDISNRLTKDEDKIVVNANDIKTLRADLSEEIINRKSEDKKLEQEIIALENSVTGRLQKLKSYVDIADLSIKNWFNTQLELLKQWVEEHYQKTYTLMNPWRGYKTSLDNVVDDIFSVYRPLSMSCLQLDSIIPEVTYIDSENISCNDFDFNGLRVKQYLSDAYMHSPVSGRYLKLQDVIAEIMTRVVVTESIGVTQSSNRAFSGNYYDNTINPLDQGLLPANTIEQLDERLALKQNYTTVSALDMYTSGVLRGDNIFTANESILRYESTYN